MLPRFFCVLFLQADIHWYWNGCFAAGALPDDGLLLFIEKDQSRLEHMPALGLVHVHAHNFLAALGAGYAARNIALAISCALLHCFSA